VIKIIELICVAISYIMQILAAGACLLVATAIIAVLIPHWQAFLIVLSIVILIAMGMAGFGIREENARIERMEREAAARKYYNDR